MESEQLVKNYIIAWSTTNSKERKQLVEKIYSNSAEFYANEPGDIPVKHIGIEKIYENITQVNERLVKGNELLTELTGYSENHGTLKVAWKMKTPDGKIAMRGTNFLHLNHSHKIERDYIFIN